MHKTYRLSKQHEITYWIEQWFHEAKVQMHSLPCLILPAEFDEANKKNEQQMKAKAWHCVSALARASDCFSFRKPYLEVK